MTGTFSWLGERRNLSSTKKKVNNKERSDDSVFKVV